MDLNQQIFAVAKSSSCRIVTPEPCGLIIFGASGDLARRKLIPAIYRLFRQKLLPAGFFVLGIARTEMSTAQYRQLMLDGLNDGFMGECDHACWRDFSSMLNYRSIDYDDPKSYRQNISEYLPLLEEGSGSEGNRIFYLATPPTVCQDIIANLQAAGLSKEKGNYVKIVIEKPFGRDTESSQKLDASLLRGFEERQIYRIDHYLAKETVQNILMFRFANSIFEPLWNRRYIDHIQITAMETLGIEQRAGYYEQSGVLRDMFQNHMLQLLSLTAMEPPALFTPERVREEKAKVFQSVRPFPLDRLDELLVTGQYGKGTLNGEAVRGYREEPGVAADSRTPTYAALKLFVDNWRWNGVPFYLRSGKRMRRRTTEISIHFKPVPHMMFTEAMGGGIDANILVLKVQPDEGITLEFQAKNPGSRVCLMPVQLNFAYLRNIALEAYERVLLDCMEGDQMLFVREDAVSLTWELLTPLIERVESGEDHPLSLYAAGSDGPAEAVQLLERGGRLWRAL